MTSPPIQVYLCCAAEDEAPHGRALFAQLRGFLRPEALALHRQFLPGADMRAEITERLTQAAVVVVLDSPALRTDPEYLAIVVPHLQRRRALGLPILPVRLRAVATEPCLEGLASIPPSPPPASPALEPALAARSPAAQDELWRQVAAAARGQLETQGVSTTVGDALSSAIQLDRQRQWRALRAACCGEADQLFLAYGQRRQGLWFFCQRAARFLASAGGTPSTGEACPPMHDVVTVPLWGEELRGTEPEEYEDFLRDALRRHNHDVPGRASGQLARAAQQHPVLLLLGRGPLTELVIEPEEREALGGFLSARLPALLANSRQPPRPAPPRVHPVRALLAFEHDHPELLPWALKAAQAARAEGLSVTVLDELALPAWDEELRADLLVYLRGDEAQLAEVAQLYPRLLAANRRFEDLTEVLNHKLERRRPWK